MWQSSSAKPLCSSFYNGNFEVDAAPDAASVFWIIFHWLIVAVFQAATVGAAAATDTETAQMIRSLTLIGPTAFRGNSNSFLLNAWAYFFGVTLDTVRIFLKYSSNDSAD